MDNPQVLSTSIQSVEVSSACHIDEASVRDGSLQFDVSDILADYFTEKINKKTSRDDHIRRSSYRSEVESCRDERKTSNRHKKHKRDRKKSKRRDEESFDRRDSRSRYRHQRESRDFKGRQYDDEDDRKHRSYRSRSRDRRRSRSRSPKTNHRKLSSNSNESRGFNRSELFEVARRNVKQMLDNGTLPKGFAVDPGKMGLFKEQVSNSIERYTQMCRKIRDEDENEPSSSRLNHPFTVKDKPIKMNIANSISLPIKSSKEKILSAQFPVSSGSSHRKLEWHPVQAESPGKRRMKKTPDAQMESITIGEPEPENRVAVPTTTDKFEAEIRSLTLPQLLKRRDEVIRRLQDNPFDIEAKETEKYCHTAIKESNACNLIPGQLSDSVDPNVKFLSQSELRNGPQAWTRRNQLKNTKALIGGIGMTLLQKMGWTPGTALGKNREGVLEPVLPDVKFDRKGLVAQEELVRLPSNNPTNSTANRSAPEAAAIQKVIDQALSGKHPVTLILEICTARKLQQPRFIDLPPKGEPHDRTFLCRVEFNGKVFVPAERSLTKKLAKAQAALLVLADMGEYNASKHGLPNLRSS